MVRVQDNNNWTEKSRKSKDSRRTTPSIIRRTMKTIKSERTKKSVESIKSEKRLLEAYETYNKLVSGKVDNFNTVKAYLSKTLEELYQEGKITSTALILSRIKSPASTVENWKAGKGLYDIFGTSIITRSQEEIETIESRLLEKGEFMTSQKKSMNEKRGYEAIHFVFHVGNDSKKDTLVECHMQTHENYKNVYTHILYKVRRRLGRDLTPDEEIQVMAEVQSMYEQGTIFGHKLSGSKKSRMPQMWVTSFNKQGKMEEQELDEDVVLKIMYPFLDMSKKKQAGTDTTKKENNVSTVTQPEER